VRLNVKSVLLGVKSASNIESEGLARSSAKLRGDLTHGDGVHIDHTVEALVIFTVMREVLDRAEIVTYRKIAAGLNARKADFLIV
jgi:hypothetical protein